MAISLDASTPVMTNITTSTTSPATWVTPSFSPPAGSLVVICAGIGFAAAQTTAPAVTVKDSSSTAYTAGPVSFTNDPGNNYSFTQIFTNYYATAPGSITVTPTRTGNLAEALLSLMPYVLDGAAAVQTGAATLSVDPTAYSTAVEGSITPTVAGSWVIALGMSASAMTWTPVTVGAYDNYYNDTSADGAAMICAHAVTSALTAETVGWTISASSTWALVALEILPAVALLPQQMAHRSPVSAIGLPGAEGKYSR